MFQQLLDKSIPFDQYEAGADQEHLSKIKKVVDIAIKAYSSFEYKNGIKVLVFSEPWCPDCVVNVTVLKTIMSQFGSVPMALLPREGNEDMMKSYLGEGPLKIPTFIFLNDNDDVLGIFIERPIKIQDMYKENPSQMMALHEQYKAGEFIEDSIEEFIEILSK